MPQWALALARRTIPEDTMKPGCTLIAYLHAKPKKRVAIIQAGKNTDAVVQELQGSGFN